MWPLRSRSCWWGQCFKPLHCGLQVELHGTMTDHTKEVASLKQALKRAEKLAEERLHQLQQEQGAHSHLRREAEQQVGRRRQLRHQVGQG